MTEDLSAHGEGTAPESPSESESLPTEVLRHVAPGGLRRMIVGFACGLAVGAVIALLLPRDDGPRRRAVVAGDVVIDAAPPSGAVARPDGVA